MFKFGDKLSSNNHSVFKLKYHLILVTKYRSDVINDEISDELRVIFERVGKGDFIIDSWNHDNDHIHILFETTPSVSISKFLNSYKSASSRVIKNRFPQIKKRLWKSSFWSKSYCLITTGSASVDVIKQYIESQGKK